MRNEEGELCNKIKVKRLISAGKVRDTFSITEVNRKLNYNRSAVRSTLLPK